ncbi:hypothetical protein ACH5RR_017701 [Cinchona calisaya]|uniref:Protein NLP7-like n=1 Tax=Cinchona calisaya TaxID=153742 RepID=A0ABD2ZJB6_9GENT
MATEAQKNLWPLGFPMSDLGPCEISWNRRIPTYPWPERNLCIFWSTYNDELRYSNSPLVACDDTFSGNDVIKQKIKTLLQHSTDLYLTVTYLVQFWGLVKIGDKMYLTTCDQPFGLSLHQKYGLKGLCEYRKSCLDYLIPLNQNGGTQVVEFGPPGRVFTSGLPESVIDACHYSTQEYPQLDRLAGRVVGYWAMPVYDQKPPNQLPIGVLEIVSSYQGGQYCFSLDWPEVGLSTRRGVTWLYDFLSHSDKLSEIKVIVEVLNVVCGKHQLPVAQIWINDNSREELAALVLQSFCLPDFSSFIRASGNCFLRKGHGVVGKAFSSQSACFCRDIRQLSITEYSLVPNARKFGFSACFAICLRSSCQNNCTYTLEFFFPVNEAISEDPRTVLEMLMASLKQQFHSNIFNFKIASGQELGEKLFVEVLKVSSDDKLDSFEICHCDSFGEVMTPTDCSFQQVDAVNKSNNDINVVQNVIVGSPPPAPELIQQVVSITEEQPIAELGAANEAGEATSVEHRGKKGINSRKQGRVTTLEIERGITREILEQNSTRKLKDVAEFLGVSRSTFKRICRNHNIRRWPPHKARKCNQAFAQQEIVQPCVENIGKRSMSNATSVQDDTRITVKATYKDDMIKFQLPLPARKMDLEEMVARKLNLSIGSFKIKYEDEDDNWILITSDEDVDLNTSLSKLISLGRTTINMSVHQITVT